MDLVEYLFIGFAAFLAYLSFLRNSISDQIDQFLNPQKSPRSPDFFGRRRIFLPVKFELADEYPDKEILRRARRYDKLLGIFYVVFMVLVAIMVIVVML